VGGASAADARSEAVVTALAEAIQALGLIDHHVHGALSSDADDFEQLITESDRPLPDGLSGFDSQLGFAIRRWCAPVLGLEPHPPAEDYLAARRALGAEAVNRRLLEASGVAHYLLDTGYAADRILDLDGMAEASGAGVDEVVRLEAVAESVAESGCSAADFADRFAAALEERTRGAVGTKTIVAYRLGLDFDPRQPTDREVRTAAGRWFKSTSVRLDGEVLLRHVIWAGVHRGLPLQFHVGFGDPDLRLDRANPLLLRDFVELAEPCGTPLMLLHCYPYHREAGFLAHAYSNVSFDVGLAVNYTGARAAAIVAESLETAPFGKLLFSSDAWGPAELHYLGAHLWRRAIARVLGEFVDAGEWSEADAIRVATMIGRDNARRVYGLPGVA
jgi:predicted TIM-barrel fold metal-dependent hydrolase